MCYTALALCNDRHSEGCQIPVVQLLRAGSKNLLRVSLAWQLAWEAFLIEKPSTALL